MDDRGQAAVEYILLVALGLFLMIIAFTLAFYVKQFTDITLLDIAQTRNETIAMFLE
jgi:Flp pilus assembly pilin Flp